MQLLRRMSSLGPASHSFAEHKPPIVVDDDEDLFSAVLSGVSQRPPPLPPPPSSAFPADDEKKREEGSPPVPRLSLQVGDEDITVEGERKEAPQEPKTSSSALVAGVLGSPTSTPPPLSPRAASTPAPRHVTSSSDVRRSGGLQWSRSLRFVRISMKELHREEEFASPRLSMPPPPPAAPPALPAPPASAPSLRRPSSQPVPKTLNPSEEGIGSPAASPYPASLPANPFDDAALSPSPPSLPCTPSTPTAARPKRVARSALYAYTAAAPDQLSLFKGELVEVLDDSHPHWTRIRNADDLKGLVPSAYLRRRPLQSSAPRQRVTASHRRTVSQPDLPPSYMRAAKAPGAVGRSAASLPPPSAAAEASDNGPPSASAHSSSRPPPVPSALTVRPSAPILPPPARPSVPSVKPSPPVPEVAADAPPMAPPLSTLAFPAFSSPPPYESVSSSSSALPSPSSSSSFSSVTAAVEVCESMFAYASGAADQLSLREGEKLLLIDRSHPHWWKVVNGRGETGLVPTTYIRLFTADAPTPTASLPSLATPPPPPPVALVRPRALSLPPPGGAAASLAATADDEVATPACGSSAAAFAFLAFAPCRPASSALSLLPARPPATCSPFTGGGGYAHSVCPSAPSIVSLVSVLTHCRSLGSSCPPFNADGGLHLLPTTAIAGPRLFSVFSSSLSEPQSFSGSAVFPTTALWTAVPRSRQWTQLPCAVASPRHPHRPSCPPHCLCAAALIASRWSVIAKGADACAGAVVSGGWRDAGSEGGGGARLERGGRGAGVSEPRG